ncbi:GGDEF domain-containing protein [Actinoplanes sp. NPDC051470]|uniref:GGDEF domain-containing protein n=1 Tax=Actinoplanes sp. NPDC051470 TaxID=3157224 RepID=UPI00342BB376
MSDALDYAQERLDWFDTTAALAVAERIVAEARTGRHPEAVLARALTVVAGARRGQDEYPESMKAALEALEIWQRIGDLAGEAFVRCVAARVLVAVGQGDEAIAEADRALVTADQAGDRAARIRARTTLGAVCVGIQQFELSVEHCLRGLDLARGFSDDIAVGALLDTMACGHIGLAEHARAAKDEGTAQAELRRAGELSSEAMRMARKNGHRRHEAVAVANLAEGVALAGRPEEALELLEGFFLDPGQDARAVVTHHLDSRGWIYLTLGRYDEAIALFAEAVALAEGDTAAMISHDHLAQAYEKAGDLRKALDHFREWRALFERIASDAAQRNANVAAVRFETAQLRRESRHDSLTGLANRRSLDEVLAAWTTERAVLLVDVDRFKQVNDTFSHMMGDEVLRRLGMLLGIACRASDTPARFGGEEFAVVLEQMDREAARDTAERLRSAVETYDWGTVADGLAITISVGVAHAGDVPDVPALLTLADRNLYCAKHGGRNRVCA